MTTTDPPEPEPEAETFAQCGSLLGHNNYISTYLSQAYDLGQSVSHTDIYFRSVGAPIGYDVYLNGTLVASKGVHDWDQASFGDDVLYNPDTNHIISFAEYGRPAGISASSYPGYQWEKEYLYTAAVITELKHGEERNELTVNVYNPKESLSWSMQPSCQNY